MTRPLTFSLVIARNAPSKSSGPWTTTGISCIFNVRTGASASFRKTSVTALSVVRIATRVSFGTTSFSSSKVFPPVSALMFVSPVTFPPGRAKLATSPVPTGSVLVVMTIGIVLVAFLRARVRAEPSAITMSTFNRTSSAARSAKRSVFPPPSERQSQCSCPRHSRDRAVLAQTLVKDRTQPRPDNRSKGFSSAVAPRRKSKAQRAWRTGVGK